MNSVSCTRETKAVFYGAEQRDELHNLVVIYEIENGLLHTKLPTMVKTG